MRLFYRTYGIGIPIVALHGLYASRDSWIGPIVNELSHTYQVILVDIRNHGRSPHSQDHSYSLMSEDLLELLDELSIEQAILLGHSMGGKVAMHFSLHYPERVKGLIVEDISPLAYLQNHENVIYHQNIINALKSLPINHFTSRKEAEIALSKAINDVSLNKFLLKNLQRNKDGKLVWRIDLGVLVKNLYRIMENITDEVKPSDIYSLFIRGSLSKYISNEDEVAIKTFFPRSTIKTIQNAGHWTHNEQQSDFLQTVKQYLSLLNSADYQISHSQ